MDTVANMMTTLINAQRVRKERVAVPYSIFKEQLARFLQEKQVIGKVRIQEGVRPKLVLALAYEDGEGRIQKIRRISKPGNRHYVGHTEMPFMAGRPGFYVLSTSQGLMDQEQARGKKLGGELVCEIWSSRN